MLPLTSISLEKRPQGMFDVCRSEISLVLWRPRKKGMEGNSGGICLRVGWRAGDRSSGGFPSKRAAGAGMC